MLSNWLRGAFVCCVCLHQTADAIDWGTILGAPSALVKHAADELTSDTIANFIRDNAVAGILFYAPWCFYSQQVMPQWDLAVQKLKLHDPPVALAKIDVHRYSDSGETFGITGFPTMKLFIDGAVFEYDAWQGRGWQQIVKWVNRHVDRDHVLKRAEDVDQYLNDNALSLIGLFSDDSFNSSIFARAARHFDDVTFAEVKDAKLAEDVAGHLSHHALLSCETVDVGTSSSNKKVVRLPRVGMHCNSHPSNQQRPDWSDRFSASVQDAELSITRSDSTDGWQQHLQLKCCDEMKESHDSKKHEYQIPVPSLVMLMPHDERFAVYDGDLSDINQINTWVGARQRPLISHLTQDTVDRILNHGAMPVLFHVSAHADDETESVLRIAAKEIRGRAIVCMVGTMSSVEKRFMDLLGVEDEHLPLIALFEARASAGDYHNPQKFRFPMREGLEPARIAKFVDDWKQGRLKPWTKSEPEPSPAEAEGHPVAVLVGTTFASVAHDATKDVLVDMYAPWCGHCRKFEPSYKELAHTLKHVRSLKIAKIDATRNEIEGMHISGFPTIVLFAAGSTPKKQFYYQGNRQPDDMMRWLHDKCGIKFDEQPPAGDSTTLLPESGLLDPSEDDL
mmetsp:Transcript_88068/g.247572  ORF Transcript_88068/g.247572 Transcript_88068/m.247572 type:complete len:619 (+) Transcript_88068:89-1945(+)